MKKPRNMQKGLGAAVIIAIVLVLIFPSTVALLQMNPIQSHQCDHRQFKPHNDPHIEDYWNSGCLTDPIEDPQPYCGEDVIELIIDGTTLSVIHKNATYNCCAEDLVISLAIEGDLLLLTEEEIVPDPCYCICCFRVEATIVDLEPGEYTVIFCWYDYDTSQEECFIEDILI